MDRCGTATALKPRELRWCAELGGGLLRKHTFGNVIGDALAGAVGESARGDNNTPAAGSFDTTLAS